MIATCSAEGTDKAASVVKAGGIVVFPTDTVYGIGCDPFNEDAVRRVYKIKGRSETKQLPVLGFSVHDISKIADFDDVSTRLAKKFWPGPLTMILSARDDRITRSLGLRGKIAVRIPNHPCALELLSKCRLLVGTSANKSGQTAAAEPSEIIKKLDGYDLLLDGGPIPSPLESTIAEIEQGKVRIVRRGKIEEKEILSLA